MTAQEKIVRVIQVALAVPVIVFWTACVGLVIFY